MSAFVLELKNEKIEMFIKKEGIIFYVFLKIYPPNYTLVLEFSFSHLFSHLQAGAAREGERMEGLEEVAREGSQVWAGEVQTWQGSGRVFLSVSPLAGLWLPARAERRESFPQSQALHCSEGLWPWP